jgi:hypothetical protein
MTTLCRINRVQFWPCHMGNHPYHAHHYPPYMVAPQVV